MDHRQSGPRPDPGAGVRFRKSAPTHRRPSRSGSPRPPGISWALLARSRRPALPATVSARSDSRPDRTKAAKRLRHVPRARRAGRLPRGRPRRIHQRPPVCRERDRFDCTSPSPPAPRRCGRHPAIRNRFPSIPIPSPTALATRRSMTPVPMAHSALHRLRSGPLSYRSW